MTPQADVPLPGRPEDLSPKAGPAALGRVEAVAQGGAGVLSLTPRAVDPGNTLVTSYTSQPVRSGGLQDWMTKHTP